MNKKELRPYQQEAIDAVASDFERGLKRVILHLFTGAGKTVVSMEMVAQHFHPRKARTLFIGGVNRDLVEQTYLEFVKHFPEWYDGNKVQIVNPLQPRFNIFAPHLGIVMGNRNDASARVIIGSIQTLVDKTDSVGEADPESLPITIADVDMRAGFPRLAAKSKRRFLVSQRMDEILSYGLIDLWIHDEAHHAPADGSLILINRLNELYAAIKAPMLKVIGNTATPIRNDGRAMSNVFERISFSRSLSWGIEHGYLTPPADPLSVEFLKTDAIPGNEDGHTMKELENWTEKFVDVYAEKAENRPTLAFVGSINGLSRVESGKQLAEEFNRRGIPAAWIHGGGGVDENGEQISARNRSAVLTRFKQGKIKVLTNYRVFVEGIDLPIASCVMLAKKVNDLELTQILGRILRKYEGKTDALLIDMTGQELVTLTTGSLLGYEYDPNTKAFDIAVDRRKAMERLHELIAAGYEEDIRELIAMWIRDGRYRKLDAQNALKFALEGDLEKLRKDHLKILRSLLDYFNEEEFMTGNNMRDMNAKGTVQGGDAVYRIANIIAKSRNDWYSDDKAIMSLSFGTSNALCLMPPNYTAMDKVDTLLRQLIAQPEKMEKYRPLLTFAAQLYSTFCVWHVDTRSRQIVTKRPIATDTALDRVEWKAIEYAQAAEGYSDTLAGKGKKWKSPSQDASDKQLDFLKQLGVKMDGRISKNEAVKLITHALASKPIQQLYQNMEAKLTDLYQSEGEVR